MIQRPFHPFILAMYPACFVFVHNRSQHLYGWELIVVALAVIPATLVVWFVLNTLTKDRHRSAALTSVFWMLFFSYGHFQSFAAGIGVDFGVIKLGSNVIWASTALAVMGAAAWVMMRLRTPSGVTRILNLMALILTLMLGVALAGNRPADTDRGPAAPSVSRVIDSKPNIYFIIADAYGNQDVLTRHYAFDNHEFLRWLNERGFRVFDAATANYSSTFPSIASTLNMDYWSELPDAAKRRGILKTAVPEALKRRGYRIMAFNSKIFDLKSADIFWGGLGQLSPFQEQIINLTPIPLVLWKLGWSRVIGFDSHRKAILQTLERLPETARLEGPLFVVAHIYAPHPPFVFDRHGNPLDGKYFSTLDGDDIMGVEGMTRSDYQRRYVEQLIFLNSRLEHAIAGILDQSRVPPIIVLIGDHGPRSTLSGGDKTLSVTNPAELSANSTDLHEIFGNLTAVYWPGKDTLLPNNLTLVNLFRVILKNEWGEDYELLADRRYVGGVDVTGKLGDNDEI